jgi:hypothetical protein
MNRELLRGKRYFLYTSRLPEDEPIALMDGNTTPEVG